MPRCSRYSEVHPTFGILRVQCNYRPISLELYLSSHPFLESNRVRVNVERESMTSNAPYSRFLVLPFSGFHGSCIVAPLINTLWFRVEYIPVHGLSINHAKLPSIARTMA